MNDAAQAIRQHLIELLSGGEAHLSFDKAVAELPPERRGAKPAGQPHTPWRLIEHMRIAQWDILEFSRNPAHVSPKWPDEYWPKGDAPSRPSEWDETIQRFRADSQAMQDRVADRGNDLLAPFSHGSGQTLMREALLVADHNAYHLGQLVVIRRLLGAWGD